MTIAGGGRIGRGVAVWIAAMAWMIAAPGIAREKPKEKGKGSEIIATINGEAVTRAEWTEIWKADQWIAPTLKSKPGYTEQMAGRPYEDFFFREEIVKIRAMSQKYADSLPQMKAAIDALHARAAAGEDFAALAAQHSQDRGSAAQGGDLGEPKEFHDLVFPFNRIAFDLDEGEISEPFLTIFGYHICKVDRILPGSEGKGKTISVRNILIRFPSADARTESEALAEEAEVRVLDRKLCRKLVSYCTDA